MKIARNARAALLAVALCSAAAAQAAVLSFAGDATARSSGFLDPTCAPQLYRSSVSAANSSGTSSLGNFTYASSACQTPGGLASGIFAISFGSDGFAGTFNGFTSTTDTAFVFTPHFTYDILSGTGRFLGASGVFLGTGLFDSRNPPPTLNFHFDGFVDAPAVPEPATWAMMLIGFAATGFAMRRRTTVTKLQLA